MVTFEGHECAMVGTISGFLAITNNCLPKGWVKVFIHRHPIPAMSGFLCGLGILMPLTIVPIRRALKLPTNQYDAAHPNVVFPKYADVNQMEDYKYP